jgi:Bacterial Ig-like domain (group 1)
MHVMKRQTLFSRMIPLFIVMVGLSGCSLNTDVSGPSGIVKVTGDGQTAPINTVLPTALEVIIFDQFGEPLQNVTVTWSVVAPGGGSLNPATSLTDETGIATTSYTTGTIAETVTIQALVSGVPPLSFTVIVTAT